MRNEPIKIDEVKEKIASVRMAVSDTGESTATERIGNLTITAFRKSDGTVNTSLEYNVVKGELGSSLFKKLNPVARATGISVKAVFPNSHFSFFYPQQPAGERILTHKSKEP